MLEQQFQHCFNISNILESLCKEILIIGKSWNNCHFRFIFSKKILFCVYNKYILWIYFVLFSIYNVYCSICLITYLHNICFQNNQRNQCQNNDDDQNINNMKY